MRHDPFSELERLADDLFGARGAATMPLDAYRRGDEVVVNVDLPGVDPDSIDVSVERNALTIRAERHWQPASDDKLFIRERPHGTFARQIFLGDALDASKITADYRNGVLSVTIPVATEAKPRKIQVRTHDAIEASSTEADGSADRQEVTAG